MARQDVSLEKRIQREYRTRQWDVAFGDLRLRIFLYLNQLRTTKGVLSFPEQANHVFIDLREVVKQHLPEIDRFLDHRAPARIYARSVVEFAIAGLKNAEVAAAIFEEHFLSGGTYGEVAQLLGFSRISVARRIKNFPLMIAEQLWKKNRELELLRERQDTSRPSSLPTTNYESTKEQRRVRILERSFKLTTRQADVLLEFCLPGGSIGRRAIAEGMVISENTLKKHIKAINRVLGTKSMKGAVARAAKVLSRHPEAEWEV